MTQLVHAPASIVVTYRPAGQLVQAGAPAVEKVPAWQLKHAVDIKMPASAKYLPAAQLVQLAASVVVTYWPAAQSTQAEAPVLAWEVPGAQLAQLVPPMFAWYLPTAQLEHVPELVVEYMPAAHQRSIHRHSAE